MSLNDAIVAIKKIEVLLCIKFPPINNNVPLGLDHWCAGISRSLEEEWEATILGS